MASLSNIVLSTKEDCVILAPAPADIVAPAPADIVAPAPADIIAPAPWFPAPMPVIVELAPMPADIIAPAPWFPAPIPFIPAPIPYLGEDEIEIIDKLTPEQQAAASAQIYNPTVGSYVSSMMKYVPKLW